MGGDRFEKTASPQKVLVVGGGPAGLEAARVAAEHGHKVTLTEASDRLGGQFRLAGMQPRRGQILDLLDWYARQLEQLGVEVRLNTFMEAGEISSFSADLILLATGSYPPDTGFQKAIPHIEKLPGSVNGGFFLRRKCNGPPCQTGKACADFG